MGGPVSIALDSSGSLLLSDNGRNVIRKYDLKTKTLSVMAGNGKIAFEGDGGDARNAALGFSAGIALDSSGNIYIADANNERVRRVDATSGVITTVAGTGEKWLDEEGVGTRVAIS